jgi:secondary thiamine-phosphate synthase enzyme
MLDLLALRTLLWKNLKFSGVSVFSVVNCLSALIYTSATMRQAQHTLSVASRGRGLYEFTERVAEWVRASGIREGLLTLFCRHTSASLLVQENADPEVQRDLERFFARLVPDGDPLFEHVLEGPDDMPAHVRAALTQCQLSIPVSGGAMVLGTWQGIYLYEHRHEPHRREVVLKLLGE